MLTFSVNLSATTSPLVLRVSAPITTPPSNITPASVVPVFRGWSSPQVFKEAFDLSPIRLLRDSSSKIEVEVISCELGWSHPLPPSLSAASVNNNIKGVSVWRLILFLCSCLMLLSMPPFTLSETPNPNPKPKPIPD